LEIFVKGINYKRIPKGEGKMFCPRCGKKINGSDSFCSFCGARIEGVELSESLDTNEAKNENLSQNDDLPNNENPPEIVSSPQKKQSKTIDKSKENIMSTLFIIAGIIINFVNVLLFGIASRIHYSSDHIIASIMGEATGCATIPFGVGAFISVFFVLSKKHKHKYRYYLAILFLIFSLIFLFMFLFVDVSMRKYNPGYPY
jgi:endogenous inhibitor of DNA gyrase (YacG/DUF329 family)